MAAGGGIGRGSIYKSEAGKQKILVVFGDGDMLLNAEKSLERIQRLAPKVTTVLLPGVGHAVLGQAQRISDFLSGNKG